MNDLATQNDAELAQLTRAGNLSAFDELARRYQSPLLRFLRRFSASEAEDLVQDTFVKAYQRLDQFNPAREFRNWVFAIAYHEAIDHTRRRRSYRNSPATEALSSIASNSDPAAEAATADRNASLWTIARDALSSEQFAAVWLFYVEQMSAVDIAKVQGRSWVSVKVMLHRARTVLGRHLSGASFVENEVTASTGDL